MSGNYTEDSFVEQPAENARPAHFDRLSAAPAEVSQWRGGGLNGLCHPLTRAGGLTDGNGFVYAAPNARAVPVRGWSAVRWSSDDKTDKRMGTD